MNAHTPADTRRRTTLAAVSLAVLVGVGALIFATEQDATAMPATSATQAPAPAPAAGTPPPVAETLAVPTPAAVTTADPAATAVDATVATDPAAVDDPFADVIIEAVDPAEALFGDQAAVAVSN